LRLAESSSAAFLACPTAAVRRGVQAAEFQAPFVASSLALIFERLAGCDRQLALA
jgi:sulfur relay (sulfurtransferase) complex TusBCD TusD component (DsrE family)